MVDLTTATVKPRRADGSGASLFTEGPMGDSQTVFERIGNWFKKHNVDHVDHTDNGEMPLAPQPGRVEREPRTTFLTPWRRRDAAIADLQNGFGTLTDLM